MTVISVCIKCHNTVVVELGEKSWTHGLKFLCSECANNPTGLIIDDQDIENLSKSGAIVPYIGGFKTGKLYESEEEKALKELKKFCIVGE